jgi:hypothetical protein
MQLTLSAQSNFEYDLLLEPVSFPNLPGLHSYAFGQHDGKWLVLGGRKDGLHARQPFNAFPAAQNNTDIYVIDVDGQQFWSASVTSLPTSIAEQLQSTNMNFHQDGDTLYIIGGYAFSASANDHKTFDKLTTIQVSSLMDDIINGNPIQGNFKQISSANFALCGAQMGMVGDTFYVVGGHRFDGRYNPMGNPTYTQAYSNQIRKFRVDNSGTQLSINNYSTITDAVHLRRRDYNLLPQIFPDGTEGFTISSGVFQAGVDAPFLYPVDIKPGGYTPQTGFNQYLSNYHSAKTFLYDSLNNRMHNIFFGGMSQYYYQNGNLVQDNQVPFVKTISRLTRLANGNLEEVQLPIEMPALHGASAEFIPNRALPQYKSEIIKLADIQADTFLAGYIYGGISSPTLNPFSSNQTSTTSASNIIYSVKFVRQNPVGNILIDGSNPYSIEVFPNPLEETVNLRFSLEKPTHLAYYITDMKGDIIAQASTYMDQTGLMQYSIKLDRDIPSQVLQLSFVFDHKFYVTKQLVKK